MNPTGRRAARLNAYLQEFLLRDEPSVARQETGVTAFFSETCRALTFLIALRSLSAQARFAAQAVLFASLTLRAARNYVRYSATLRSYSGFMENTGVEERFSLTPSNQA